MSNSLFDLLQRQLSEERLDWFSQQIGGADRQQTVAAASGTLSVLVSALARNASTPEGAKALNDALERDHDGSILDDMTGMLSGQTQPPNPRMLNGAGILHHALGNRQAGAIDMISKISGLDSSKADSLMTMLAPVIMGALGKVKREQGLDVAGIAALLSGIVAAQSQQNPTMSLVNRFLDADGDGSILDDVASIGMKTLTPLFGRSAFKDRKNAK